MSLPLIYFYASLDELIHRPIVTDVFILIALELWKIESIIAVYAGKGVIYCQRGAANSLVDSERMPIAGLPILERFQFGKSFPGYRALARKEHLCLNKSPTLRPKLFACM